MNKYIWSLLLWSYFRAWFHTNEQFKTSVNEQQGERCVMSWKTIFDCPRQKHDSHLLQGQALKFTITTSIKMSKHKLNYWIYRCSLQMITKCNPKLPLGYSIWGVGSSLPTTLSFMITWLKAFSLLTMSKMESKLVFQQIVVEQVCVVAATANSGLFSQVGK